MRLIDLTGRTFGELTVLGRGADRVYGVGRTRRVRWRCRCSCGAEVLVDGDSLKDGRTRSCGHLRAEAAARRHPLRAYTAERRALRNALARCTNPRSEHFADYGGRGIRVCTEWRGEGGFERFLADVGPRPGPGWSLDRVDVDGDYAPGNVRWADRTTQARNTRRAVGGQPLTRSDGTTHTLFEWADLTGLRVGTIRWRLAHGASVDEALHPGDGRRAARPARARRHVHPDHQVWAKMHRRCSVPTDPRYPDYGGRGVRVCARWTGPEGFANFVADMGPRPPRFTLDRVDVDGDYTPSNCRWASQRVQQNNRRDNVHLTVLGVDHTAAEWAAIVGLDGRRVRARIAGWPNAPGPRIVYPGDPRRLSPAALAAVDAGEWLRPLMAAWAETVQAEVAGGATVHLVDNVD